MVKLYKQKKQQKTTLQSQGTKIFQYCTCPAERVTYNFLSSCKHIYLSFNSSLDKEDKGVMSLIKFLISLLKCYLPSQIHN